MPLPSEQFEPGKNPQQDAVQALRNQLDQLEKRGNGDPRVVEAVRNTRSRLDNLQKSLNDVHVLERTALKMQEELGRISGENAQLKESLPADVIKKLENAARVDVKSPSAVVRQSNSTQARTSEKTPDTRLRAKPGETITINGKTATLPAIGLAYARRDFSAVREGDMWVITPRMINVQPATPKQKELPAIQPRTIPLQKISPRPSEPVAPTAEKTPDTRLRAKPGETITINGKTATLPAIGLAYARRDFSAVREGDMWVITPRMINVQPATPKQKELPAVEPKKVSTDSVIKSAPPPPTSSEWTTIPARSSAAKESRTSTEGLQSPTQPFVPYVRRRNAPVPVDPETVKTAMPQNAERTTVATPQLNELMKPMDVPSALRERFDAVDRAYRDAYVKISDPSFRFKDEVNIQNVNGPERETLRKEVDETKKQMVDELLIEWKRAREAFAKAAPSSKANVTPSMKSIPPELLGVWAAKYQNAGSDTERARMFIEDAAMHPAPLLTAAQLEAVIGSRVLAKKVSGPDGVFGTKDDDAGRVKGKRTEKGMFLGAPSESTHNVDPLESQFVKYLMSLDDISSDSRKLTRELGERIGKKITVNPVNGFNTAVLDWMIQAQNSPTSKAGMPDGMEVSFQDAPSNSPAIQLAAASLPSKESEELKIWSSSPEKGRAWQDHARVLLAEDARLKTSYESHPQPEVRALYEQCQKTVAQYWRVYTDVTKQKIVDVPLVKAALDQIERAMYYYGTQLGRMAKDMSVGLRSDMPESMDPKMAKMLFYRGQRPEQIHGTLMTLSALKPFRELTDEQVRSLLYIKAHLPALAGSDGKLNKNDITAIVDGITQDVLSRPADLYSQILSREKIDVTTVEGKEKALGLRYALGMPEQTRGEYNQIKKGLSYLNSNWSWTVSKSDQAKLRTLQGLMQNDIIPGIKKDVEKQVTAFMDAAGLQKQTGIDAGHGAIKESDMTALDRHAKVLKGISHSSLQPVREATGAAIDTHAPEGLNMATVEWMLDAHARPQGRLGMPPGTVLRIDQRMMPVSAPQIAKEPEPLVPVTREAAQVLTPRSVDSQSAASAKAEMASSEDEEELIPINADSVTIPLEVPVPEAQASVAPENQEKIIAGILVDKEAKQIVIPTKDAFRIDYQPNPTNLPSTFFSPDKMASLEGIAVSVRRNRDSWVVTVKPGYEKFVVLTRESDKATVRLAEFTPEERAKFEKNASPEVLQSEVIVIRSEADFQREVRESTVPVIVDFKTWWCGPCRRMQPFLEQIAKERKGSVKIVQVDAEALPALAKEHKINLYPTLIVYKNGERQGENNSGYKTKSSIEKLIPRQENIAKND